MGKKYNIKPPLKWVGGKRQLLDEIYKLVPTDFDIYSEPFIGGGAVFFDLQPNKAIINDFNAELMNVYKVIRDFPEQLIKLLEKHESLNSKDYFYEVRSMDRDKNEFEKLNNVERAARTMYLNKTCYNGLYRVNLSGQFNTPFGKYKKPNIVNKQLILEISTYLNASEITLLTGDYSAALENLSSDSFVYFDPPYDPISETSYFTGYTKTGFFSDDQIRLRNHCDSLHERGIKFLQSNSDTPQIRKLYSQYHIRTVKARRTINSKGSLRGEIDEVLIFNYDPETKIIKDK